jgi:hypothetical protein
LFLVAALAACAPDAEPVPRVELLPGGGRHVVNPAPDRMEEIGHWRLRTVVTIGAAAGSGPEVFGRVQDIAADEHGQIFVLDFIAQQVRVFDSLGRHLRTFAGPGAGPGELRNPVGMVYRNGKIWVNDQTANRYSVYDGSGAFLTSHRRRIPFSGFRWEGGVDSAGRIYDLAVTFGPLSREPGLQATQWRVFALRTDPAAEGVDSIPLPRHDVQYYRTRRGGNFQIPFRGEFLWTVDAGGHVWSAFTDAYRICQLGVGTDTLLLVERDYEPLPVTAGDRADAIAGLERWMDQHGDRTNLDYSVIPSVYPAIESFDLDDRGNLWVRPVTKSETTSFDIFDTTGQLIATATANRRIYPFRPVRISGNSAWFVISDSLDVDYVVRAVIER